MRTYGHLTLNAGKWRLSQIPPHVSIRLKHLFPRLQQTAVAPFFFPDDDMHCADLAWFCERYPMEISADDQQWLTEGLLRFNATQAELETILTPDYKPNPFTGLRPGFAVRPYQAQAVDILRRRRSLLLGDDLGLGKTYTAAAFILDTAARPAAVVVQAHLQRQWEQKLTEFTTLTVHQIKGTKPYDLPPADVYVFKYTQLAGWVDIFALGIFKTVVYDEVQELRRGTESLKGQAAQVLSRHAEFRLGLSATPIYNYGDEIWRVMQMLDDTVLGSWTEFGREWLSDGVRVKDPEALGSFLREQHVFLRRTKADVGQQVPPVNALHELVECDHEQLASIEERARALAMRTVTGTFVERGQAGRELDLLLRHATGVGKARAVAAFSRILLEAQVPILLVGWHRDVYAIWLKELADFKPVMYTGSESPKQKDDAVRAFTSGQSNCFILSLRSGAGLDGLQYRCSTVIFGEFDWSKKIHEQVVGRLDREGQSEQVTVVYAYCEDGSDPPIMDVIAAKASQAHGIVDEGKLLENQLADFSRIRALAAQFLNKRQMKDFDAADAGQLQDHQPMPMPAQAAFDLGVPA